MSKYQLSPYIQYSFDGSLQEFYDMVSRSNIVVYSVEINDTFIFFKINLIDSIKLRGNSRCKKCKIYGILGLLFRQFHSVRRVLGVAVFLVIIIALRMVCFEIHIVCDDSTVENIVQSAVNEMNLYFWREEDFRQLEESLRKDYFTEIEWINISKSGSYMEIEVKRREKIEVKDNSYNSLIAYKDGVIAAFDVKSGYKLVSLDDYVVAGEELITSKFIDTSGKEQQTFVLGKVYAYTYTEITKSIHWPYNFDLTKPWAFFNLLFECRNEIANELSYDEMIIDENILQFSFEEGTINMKILYTLYEDITHP